MTNKPLSAKPLELTPELEVALAEYEYARSEIHLRLGFNRQVLNLQITLLAASVGGIVAFLDKHAISPMLIQIGAVVVLYLNLAFILEIRQNSLHTIISGNFIHQKLSAVLPKDYLDRTDGGLLANIRKYRERGRARKILLHYWSDSFLLVSTLTLIASCAGLAWTFTMLGFGWLTIVDGAAALIAVLASIAHLWGYTISDPHFVRDAMTAAKPGRRHGA